MCADPVALSGHPLWSLAWRLAPLGRDGLLGGCGRGDGRPRTTLGVLDLVPLAHLVDGRADELVLPIVAQLHHAAQQHVACAAGLVGELASAREYRLDVGCRRARRTPSAPPASGPGSACPAPSASPCARPAPALGTAGCARRRALAAPSGPVCTGHWGWRQIGTRKLQAVQVWGTCQPASATGSQWTFQCRGRARTASASLG